MYRSLFLLCLIYIIRIHAMYPVNQGYNETEAKFLIRLSAGTYGELQDIHSCLHTGNNNNEVRTLLKINKESCDVLNNPCEGYIAVVDSDKVLYVVFRGTKTNTQLLLEGWATTKPGDNFFGMGHISSYFMRGHLLLWPELNNILTSAKYTDYVAVFTGHSLGGALAALAAARTVVEGIRPANRMRVVTFGEPRVGDRQFGMAFDNMIPNSFRVVYRQDIVPHMPGCAKDRSNHSLTADDSLPCDPDDLYSPYHHGLEIWYPESMTINSSYIECRGQPISEDFACSNQFKYKAKYYSSYIDDHRTYFGVKVPSYGKTGCNDMYPQGY